MPASSCAEQALCSLIEVDCGIISLIKFFHFLRLSLLSSCRLRVAERRPASPLSSGASHPPHHCWSLSQLLIPPLPPLSPLFLLSPLISSQIALHTPPHSLLFSFSPPKWGGKDLAHAHSYIFPALISACHLDFTDVLWLFLPWFGQVQGSFPNPQCLASKIGWGNILDSRTKQLWSLCSLGSCEIDCHGNSVTCSTSNGFKRTCPIAVHCFNPNCLFDICDLLITMLKNNLHLQNPICGGSPGSIWLPCS